MEKYQNMDIKLDEYLLQFTPEMRPVKQIGQSLDLALCECRSSLYGRFYISKLNAKKNIVKIIENNLNNLEEYQIISLKHSFKLLTSSSSELLSQNILGIYICLINWLKRQQLEQTKTNKLQIINFIKLIIKQLAPLLFYFFVYHYFKRKEKQRSSGSQKIIYDTNQRSNNCVQENQINETCVCQIQEQFSKVNLSIIFQRYLQYEVNQLIQTIQVCKMCSQQVKLRYFQKHIKICCKKTQIQAQLKVLEQQRKKLYEEVQQFQKIIMFQTLQPTQNDLNILRIFFMMKHVFLEHKKTSCARRNTLLLSMKRDPIQQIKEQILFLEQQPEKYTLLNNLILNAQKIIAVRKKLTLIQINSKTKIKSCKDSQLSFTELEQSISNSKITGTCFKTKKSLFASNKTNQNKKKVYFQNQQSCKISKQPLSTFSINSSNSVSLSDNSILQDIKNSQDFLQNPSQQNDVFNLQKNTSFMTSSILRSKKKEAQNKENNNFQSLKILCSLDNIQQQKIGLDDFEILKFLGKGAYGKVYLVRRKITKDLYALKHIIFENAQTEHHRKLIQKQHQIFMKTAGDHIIKAPFAFSESYGHFFVLQFMPGGDLSKILTQEIYLQENQAKFYLAQIILALEYLHENDIIHRDLKPQNIVIDKKGHIKLTDFGLSDIKMQDKIVKVKQKNDINKKKFNIQRSARRVALVNRTDIAKIIGTPDYIAPEIINQTSINNYSIDWWSLGVMAYQMLVGCRPFSAMTIDEILQNILDGNIQWPEIGREQQMMSPQAYDLISKLLDKNFQRRIGSNSSQQIKKHPFFNGVDWDSIKNQTAPIIPTIQLSYLKKYANLPEDKSLRYQITKLNKSERSKTKNCMGLQNFVRYDLLLEQTYESIEQKLCKSRQRIKKLRTISQFIIHQQISKPMKCQQQQQLKQKLNILQQKYKLYKVGQETVLEFEDFDF